MFNSSVSFLPQFAGDAPERARLMRAEHQRRSGKDMAALLRQHQEEADE